MFNEMANIWEITKTNLTIGIVCICQNSNNPKINTDTDRRYTETQKTNNITHNWRLQAFGVSYIAVTMNLGAIGVPHMYPERSGGWNALILLVVHLSLAHQLAPTSFQCFLHRGATGAYGSWGTAYVKHRRQKIIREKIFLHTQHVPYLKDFPPKKGAI